MATGLEIEKKPPQSHEMVLLFFWLRYKHIKSVLKFKLVFLEKEHINLF